MKRFSLRSTLLLCLPCVLILAAGIGVSQWRETQRRARIAFYSQPFEARFHLGRGDVPKASSPGLFEIKTRCIASGGSGQYHWLLRGVLLKKAGQSSSEIWNSQKILNSNSLSHTLTGSDATAPGNDGSDNSMPSADAYFFWRFDRLKGNRDDLEFIVVAVVIPVPVPDDENVTLSANISEATPAAIAAARHQPSARYFRKSIELKASDDSKHHFRQETKKP